jgi:stearoyl-CoA desaturase (delta-9 desaturase)
VKQARLPYFQSWPLFVCHGIALVGPFLVTFAWRYVALAAILYAVRMCLLSAGYHRYFAHRSFKTSRAFQLVLALAGGTCTQRGPLWWAANHRYHHAHSDQADDIHSPARHGLFWSHLGWIVSRRYETTRLDRVRDFAHYPELRWLDRHHYIPSWLFLGTLVAIGGWPAGIWGCFVSTTFLWHATFCVNSVAHRLGRRRYPTGDESRNSAALAVATMGEGWHNNHHHYQSSSRLGFYWWEIDPTYYLLRLFAALGLVWELRAPPRAIRDSWRLTGSGS